MSEEVENANDGTFSGLKKTIIGVITTAVMGLGTWGVTQITGGGDEPAPAPAAAPVINITNSNQQQQSQGGGTTKIIERVKEVPAEKKEAPKKKSEKETLEATPAW
jgi:hypothetical protein